MRRRAGTREEPGLAEEQQRDQPTYNVLKTWAFDDWGLYGRGDELLARALARHPRVGRVFHVQPPIDPAELRSRFRDPRWEQDMEGQLRRLKGVEDDGVYLFAPTSQPDRREAALDATVAMLEREQAFAQPLLMLHSLAHPFAGDLASRLGGRGVTRVAMVRRDARAPYPVDADERQALERRLQDPAVRGRPGLGRHPRAPRGVRRPQPADRAPPGRGRPGPGRRHARGRAGRAAPAADHLRRLDAGLPERRPDPGHRRPAPGGQLRVRRPGRRLPRRRWSRACATCT